MIRIKRFFWNLLKINERSTLIANDILKNQNLIPIIETNKNDVFIAGFPKSGNTWMQNLITGILLDSVCERISPQLVSDIVPDEHAIKYYRRIFPSMVFKTHNLPNERYKKVIHLVRDGRDAMVSYYKMETNRDANFRYSIKEMIIEGKGVFPEKWHVHTRRWFDNPYKAKIIVIKYEDLLENPLHTLKVIVNFLKIEMNDDRLMEIYNANNINKLRKKVSTHGWDYDNLYKNKKPDTFFRKGTSGSYKKELDPSLEEYFVNESKKELQLFGYIK